MLNYRSFAQLVLVGRLGQDAKLHNTKNGTKMLTFGVGTSVSVKDQTGAYKSETTWHDCLMFGPRVEKMADKMLKGTFVCVQGSISYREVKLDNGYKGKTANIIVDDVQILCDGKTATARPAPASAQSSASAPDFDDYGIDDIPC